MQLQVNDLCKKFKDNMAVNHINFTLEKGVYGLLGANGSGKTTLMRMLCTLLTPTNGEIQYNGENIEKLNEKYRRILGYLPQEFGYYPEFSAEDYLLYISSLKGLKPKIAKKRVKELLEIVSLTKVSKKKIKTFSGGMKRRLGIAQAVINEPEILILDEPTAGLDPKERIRFRNLISHLAEERIVLLSTHIVSDLDSIAKEILIMKEGSIIAQGDVLSLLTPIKNSIWICEASLKEAEQLRAKYVISNEKNIGENIELRIISSEKPIISARQITPTLEDLFMYYFGEVNEIADFEI
ncbi:ABC transporter ATP-binding protein [Clostridium carboxidivorans P7]|uniref:ABC transporter related protein n=1 Tax=Clostridium carboxidivorans P7 TaxID=536227 RepID=C6PW49_9CLOT|nr:ABC transporter ATP-binding protein [Clostridium carboxidivorans]AKN30076.1 ABC transporter ATP-binding protein [Clostridium carboxidivorans P7]EET86528.1 ABC transporter related protein [Clostridium carboxidivorans P7]EFG89084.1 ABC transporter, ATP-binding protein [Clostridium carboxidivorans P7]